MEQYVLKDDEDGGVLRGGGHKHVVGSNGPNRIGFDLSAEATLDPSFARGGDFIYLEGSPGQFSAAVSGSNAVFTSEEGGRVAVPMGTAGVVIHFRHEVDGTAEWFGALLKIEGGEARLGPLVLSAVPQSVVAEPVVVTA